MADDLQSCNGSWWNAERSRATTPKELSVSCFTASSGIGGGAGFGWVSADVVEGKARSGDEPVGSGSGSGSSITYQETHTHQMADPVSGCTSSMDDALQVPGFSDLISPVFDWNQSFKSSGRAEDSFHAMISEDLSSGQLLEHQQDMVGESDRSQGNSQGSSTNLTKGGAHYQGSFLQDRHHLRSISQPPLQTSYAYTSTFVRDTLNMENKPSNGPKEDLLAKFPQFLASSSLLSSIQQPLSNRSHFSNDTLFWNGSAGATSTEARSGHFASVICPQFAPQAFDEKPIVVDNSLTIKTNSEATKKNSSETALKKPRIETPSPLPTFKVRKEKLGDRITALQQLVSPFGKTDTASVLHEAIQYIKFLHGQVGVLSNPYSKENGHPMQQQQNSSKSKDDKGPKQDLRSRGLCLVPVAITFPLASDAPPDFWTPTFWGTYR